MRVQLKWSSSRQMWIGQTVRNQSKSSWMRQVMRWITPVEPAVAKRQVQVARVWQSDRQRSF